MATDKTKNVDGPGNEVAEVLAVNDGTRFADDQLAEIKTYNDAAALFEAEGVEVESVSDFGTGFELLDNKDQLIGKPFVIVEWRFNNGDFGVFASATLITEDNRKYILNDGSTGIYKQLESITRRRVKAGKAEPQKGLLCRKGLTRSDYEGPAGPATTYYLAQ